MTPLAFGYMRTEPNISTEELTCLHQIMITHLAGQGFTLSRIFVESDGIANSAFASLIDELRASSITAVVIPSMDHLARIEGVRVAMKRLIEDQTGARVLVATAIVTAKENGRENDDV